MSDEWFLWRRSSLILVVFGIFYALITPPFQTPDEPNHFFRAWQVSEGHFFPEKMNARLGGELPLSLSQVCDSFAFLKNNPSARLRGQTLARTMTIPLQPERRRFTDFANTAIYAPTAYVPQAAAIAILRPMGATPLQLLYGVRLANLFVWLALILAAIQRMPFMRSILTALALLPATLCIAASANADVLTNGLCWWLVAVLVTSIQDGEFWKKLLAVLVVAINKLIAVPLVLLGFLFPKPRVTAMLLVAGLLGALCWGQLAQGWFIPYDAYDPAYRDTQTLNSGVDPAKQMVFVLENPLFFIKTVAQSLLKALPSMAAHLVGKFGWEKNYLPTVWLALLWLMLAALVCAEKTAFSGRQRWGMAAITALYLSAFAFTMYALWTAVGADTLDNWQGRYFLSILPVAFMAVSNGILAKWKRVIHVAAMLILLGSNLAMLGFIVWRYYCC